MRFDPRLWRGGPLTEHIGDLDVPSGQLRVCDAGTLFEPVAVTVPSGRHPVRVLRNRGGDILAAAVRVGPGEPSRWSEEGAYGVDAGLAGFFDGRVPDVPGVARAHQHRHLPLAPRLQPGAQVAVVEDAGQAGAMVPFDGGGFATCRSGHGDGIYAVYVGTDPRGAAAVVVTEFIGPDDEDLEEELDVEDAPTEQG